MGFLLGLIMFFICHTVANIFTNNLYCYIQEEKADDVNRYAMKQYLTKTIISFIVYIAIFIVAITVEAFSEHTAAILIGNGIGFITAIIHFKLMADENYIKQRAKNEWNSWNYMSFEEKREKLKKQQEANTENTYLKTPTTYQTKKSLHHIDDDDYDGVVDAQFNFFGKNDADITDIDTFWYGHYSYADSYVFKDVTSYDPYDEDSGIRSC